MWKEFTVTTKSVRAFQLNDDPEVMYIIKGGHPDHYYAVFDSAYDDTGGFEHHTALTLLQRYGIRITNDNTTADNS